jgi:hypothetical protein
MTIEQRLERLERENRWLKAGGTAVVLVLLAVGVMGAAWGKKIPDVVKARAFHVVGNDGTVLARLEYATGKTDGGSGYVTTYNAKGQALVMLAATTVGEGAVTTLNGKGQSLVTITASTNGVGMVTAYDPSGRRDFGRLAPRQ